jgi:hypothetical protein
MCADARAADQSVPPLAREVKLRERGGRIKLV